MYSKVKYTRNYKWHKNHLLFIKIFIPQFTSITVGSLITSRYMHSFLWFCHNYIQVSLIISKGNTMTKKMTIVKVSPLLLALSPVDYKDRGKIPNSKSSLSEDAKFYRNINAPSYTSVHLHENIRKYTVLSVSHSHLLFHSDLI